MTVMDTAEDRDRITTEAVEWFLLLQSGADQQAFSEWLTRSPAHIEEYLAVSSAWGALDGISDAGELSTGALIEAAREERETGNILRLADRMPQSPALPAAPAGAIPRLGDELPSWRRLQPLWTSRRVVVAAAACLFMAVAVWKGYFERRGDLNFETMVGEQRSVTLLDGSVVFLNTDSKIHIQWLGSERRVDLIRGEARFRVARNPAQPFVVLTSRAAVRVLGTEFNVRADAKSTQVAVMDGQVEVLVATAPASLGQPDPTVPNLNDGSGPPQGVSARTRLGAGERAAVTARGIESNSGPSIESVAAWTERRLVFRDEPLDSVVSEFNRYRTQPLVLDDPQLAALKISGAFDLNDTESLLAYLMTFETVRVAVRADGSEHLWRAPTTTAPR